MNIFESLPKGDSVAWSDDPVPLPDGRIADATTWQLVYALRGPSVLDLSAAPDGARWRTTLTASASASLLAGTYAWSAAVTHGAERITLVSGQLVITVDLATATAPFETRTQAQKALDDCEAAMATFNATGGRIKKYEIAGRSMEFHAIADLMSLRSFWKVKVMTEGSAAAIANGSSNPRNMYTRFVRP